MKCVGQNIHCKSKVYLISVLCSGLILLFIASDCVARQKWTFKPAEPDKIYSERDRLAENASWGGPPGGTFFIGTLHYYSSGGDILSETVRYQSSDMIARKVAKYGGDYYTITTEGKEQEVDKYVRNYSGKMERKRFRSISETFKVYRKLSSIKKPTKSTKDSEAYTYLRKGRYDVIDAEETYQLGLAMELTKSMEIIKYKMAIRNFTNAIKIDPELGLAYGDRGRAYYSLWRIKKEPVLLEKSEADLIKAIELIDDKAIKSVYKLTLDRLRRDKKK